MPATTSPERSGYNALLLFAATALTLWALGLILSPFLVPVAWAMCLATVTGGLYRRLAARTRRPAFSAVVMTLLVAVALVLPLVVIGNVVVQEARALSSTRSTAPPARPGAKPAAPAATPAPNSPTSANANEKWDKFFAEHPRFAKLKDRIDRQLESFDTDLRTLKDESLAQLGEPFATGALGFLQGFMSLAFGFLITLATLYFLYRDGDAIKAVVIDLVPLPEEQTRRILETLRSTTFGAIVGGLLAAIVQGVLGGIAFWITGATAPVLWGFVMAVLSLLPVGGSAFVWAPAAAYFFAMDMTWQAWFLVIWGVAVMGASANFVLPLLMRRAGASNIPTLLLFFAILSGIGIFGFSGIVFGPLLLAFVLVVIKIYREHYGRRALAHRSNAT